MVIHQARSKRKISGGKQTLPWTKKKKELGGFPTLTKIGALKIRTKRGRGGKKKKKAISLKQINVYDPKTKKYSKADIVSVLQNKASRHYVRRQIITKGAIVETNLGNAIVTNRPGQEGFINAKLFTGEIKKEVFKKEKSKEKKVKKHVSQRDKIKPKKKGILKKLTGR